MTIKEFISLTQSDAKLMKALDTEKPEGFDAFVEFARKYGYSIEAEELDEITLSNVIGGMIPITEPSAKTGLCWHTGCKGQILNVGNLFRYCECERCHETHYWLWDFDYYTT